MKLKAGPSSFYAQLSAKNIKANIERLSAEILYAMIWVFMLLSTVFQPYQDQPYLRQPSKSVYPMYTDELFYLVCNNEPGMVHYGSVVAQWLGTCLWC